MTEDALRRDLGLGVLDVLISAMLAPDGPAISRQPGTSGSM
jgi:hypothetical protein